MEVTGRKEAYCKNCKTLGGLQTRAPTFSLHTLAYSLKGPTLGLQVRSGVCFKADK